MSAAMLVLGKAPLIFGKTSKISQNRGSPRALCKTEVWILSGFSGYNNISGLLDDFLAKKNRPLKGLRKTTPFPIPLKNNMSPEKGSVQKETRLPTIICQGQTDTTPITTFPNLFFDRFTDSMSCSVRSSEMVLIDKLKYRNSVRLNCRICNYNSYRTFHWAGDEKLKCHWKHLDWTPPKLYTKHHVVYHLQDPKGFFLRRRTTKDFQLENWNQMPQGSSVLLGNTQN